MKQTNRRRRRRRRHHVVCSFSHQNGVINRTNLHVGRGTQKIWYIFFDLMSVLQGWFDTSSNLSEETGGKTTIEDLPTLPHL